MRNKNKIKSILKRRPQKLNNSDTNEALIVFQGLLDSHSVSFATDKKTGISTVKNQFYNLNKQKRRQFVTEFINNNFTPEQVQKLREINRSGNNANLSALGIKTRLIIDEIKTDKRSKNVKANYHYGNKRYGTYQEGDALDVQNLIQKRQPLPKSQRIKTGLSSAAQKSHITPGLSAAMKRYTRGSLEELLNEIVPGTTLEQGPVVLMGLIKKGVDSGELNGVQVVELINLRDGLIRFLENEKAMQTMRGVGFTQPHQVQAYRVSQALDVNLTNNLGDALLAIDSDLIAYSDQKEEYQKHDIKTINPLIRELEKNKL